VRQTTPMIKGAELVPGTVVDKKRMLAEFVSSVSR
jgi:hypothetical protein